jgi:ribosome biogenesis GTPase
MTLEALGWTPALAAAFATDPPSHVPGRIIRIDRGRATASTGDEVVHLVMPSELRSGDAAVVVGDWVAIDPEAPDGPLAIRRLPRTCVLVRRAPGRQVRRQVLVANVDLVFILSSMDEDFSERRLERYLTIVAEGGARPVILLTKAADAADPADFVARAEAVAPGVDVCAIDVVAGLGSEVARSYLREGVTAVLVGSSGVGKSTLLNHLAGDNSMLTRPVREHDGTGQHTTSHRELFVLDEGGVVIDTPGLRELAPWAETAAVDEVFSDIEALVNACRFRDCTHGQEPGCAVREATERGEVDPERLAGYFALRGEVEQTAAQMPTHERRKGERKVGKLYREIQRSKRGRR